VPREGHRAYPGLTAVEIGKALGARVIAAAGGMEKLAVARSRGAYELIASERPMAPGRDGGSDCLRAEYLWHDPRW